MATYVVTFRIANRSVDGASYADRYSKLADNLKTEGMGYWSEPASFILAESDLDTISFGKKAVVGLSPKYDMLFLFDPSDQSGCYFGAVEHEDVLRSFFPSSKKLG